MSNDFGFNDWFEFYNFIGAVLDGVFENVQDVTDFGTDIGIDYIVETQEGEILVDVRGVMPMTFDRIQEIVMNLEYVRKIWISKTGNSVRTAIVLPGVLAADRRQQFDRLGIFVWDSAWIMLMASRIGIAEEAQSLLQDPYAPAESSSPGAELVEKLESIPAGKVGWSAYQSLCGNILEFLFCPPLNRPILERSNMPGTNRRDFILPNYCTDGVWKFLGERYQAEYIVADAKNYTGEVEKSEILQLANYLSEHGAGLFGLIITRNQAGFSAEQTVREQWIMHRKMICIISDGDIKQMIVSKEHGQDPAILIRQKIEDFRLAF